MAFGLRFAIAEVKSFAVADDGSKAVVTFGLVDGSEVGLDLPIGLVDSVSLMLRDAKAASGKTDPRSLHLQVFNTWEVGFSQMHGSVSLVIDRGHAGEHGFAAHPKTARGVGRALIAAARTIEQAAATASKSRN